MMVQNLSSYYKGKTVLLTGHTGFKGSWLAIWLHLMGAKVVGYGLDPKTPNDLFHITGLADKIIDVRGDITDYKQLKEAFDIYEPQIIFHLAAQPLVRASYDAPYATFKTNMLGTLNVLECIRNMEGVLSAVIITTDKCYKNKEWIWGYREQDELGGHDPYSASKACAELAVESYIKSFFWNRTPVATARAGNVIGGGDWAEDRIIPDAIRALQANQKIIVRNPNAVRAWQHVLDPLHGYLHLAQRLHEKKEFAGAWNFGPQHESIIPVKELVELFIREWGAGEWMAQDENKSDCKTETHALRLAIDKARYLLNWKPRLGLQDAIMYTVEWYKGWIKSKDTYLLCRKQIEDFCALE